MSQSDEHTQTLLDPPQIAETIRSYFQNQPDQGEMLWSMIKGSDDLISAWEKYESAGQKEQFWEHTWNTGIKLEGTERDALWEMHRNPRHPMMLCHDASILSLACELFAAISGNLPEDAPARISGFTDALLSHAAEKMGDLMDAGHPATEFWSPDSWWLHRGWDEAAVRLAGLRDPVRVAHWLAEANPLVAARCVTGSSTFPDVSKLHLKEFDLGELAFQKLLTIIQSRASYGWDSPIYRLAYLAAYLAPNRAIILERLQYLIERCIPEVFQQPANDWLSIIEDSDLPGFFYGFSYSIESLQKCAEHFADFRPDKRAQQLILHNDDERGLRTLISIMISRGFKEQVQLISVEGSAGGLILASVLLPDLILTDVMEPGMDGFTFAKYLKKNPATRNIPLVFLTARGDPESFKMGMELGATRYISKPILHHDLIAALREVMGIEE